MKDLKQAYKQREQERAKVTRVIQERLRKIIDIGHKHEEVMEWVQCSECGIAHTKWKAEREKLRKLYPFAFEKGRLAGKNII